MRHGMTSVNVSDRVKELTDWMVRSFNAARGRKSWSISGIPAQRCEGWRASRGAAPAGPDHPALGPATSRSDHRVTSSAGGTSPSRTSPSSSGEVAGTLTILVLMAAVLVYTGWSTFDFVWSWDENIPLNLAIRAFQTGDPLPRFYLYPSMSYVLTALCGLPVLVVSGFRFDAVVAYMQTPGFTFLPRSLFFVLTNLAAVWAYLLCRALGFGRATAAAAFGLAAFSWEFNYHSRWITADGIMAQFAVLTVLAAVKYLTASSRGQFRLLVLGSVAAGFAMACKYPAGLVVLPVWTTIVFVHASDRWCRYGMLALSGAIMLAAFVVITPAVVLDTRRLLADVATQSWIYKTGHLGHSVRDARMHLSLMLDYFASAALSHFRPVAVLLFACAAIGVVELGRRGWRFLWTVVPWIILYVVYFSEHRVMFVRNLQIVLPGLAVLAAIGVAALVRLAARTHPVLGAGVVMSAVAVIGVNMAWTVYAARTIAAQGHLDARTQVVAYAARPSGCVNYSPRVTRLVYREHEPTRTGRDCRETIFYADEIPWPSLRANRYGRYHMLPGGPYDRNLDYYPEPLGPRPIVMATVDLPPHGWGPEAETNGRRREQSARDHRGDKRAPQVTTPDRPAQNW